MKRIITTLAFLVLTASTAFAATATAQVEPVAKADADIAISDSGTALTVFGKADGFVPGLSYISFFYGKGSTATGPASCLPSTSTPLTPIQMLIGYWLPVSGTTRTLMAVKTLASYAPLSQIGTVSVRYDSTPQLNPLVNMTPLRYYLQSCGAVKSAVTDTSARVRLR